MTLEIQAIRTNVQTIPEIRRALQQIVAAMGKPHLIESASHETGATPGQVFSASTSGGIQAADPPLTGGVTGMDMYLLVMGDN